MYRFLLTARWLGMLALALALAAVMVLLGNWQLSRYEERTAVNERIDAAGQRPPTPLAEVVPAPVAGTGSAGQAPPDEAAWTRATVSGRYDTSNVILVRGRTVNSKVGFEVVTPLVLADGSAVLVDRGWVPPPPGDATAQPQVPPPPPGEVTVVGRVRLSESSDRIYRRGGRLETRRISVPQLAAQLPYPVYGAYLLLDEQDPPADPAFAAVPVGHQNNWQNGGYVVQWWIFAGMVLVGFGWLARREAHDRRTGGGDRTAEPAPASAV